MLSSRSYLLFRKGLGLFRQITVEEKYEMLHPVEHILQRPDMYVGSNNLKSQHWWLYDELSSMMTQRKITFNPAFYKIFDEILVNAADNTVRDHGIQTYICVLVNEKTGCITIKNDGRGIPVEVHRQYNMWIPELIFGHLMTSSNYSEGEDLTVGGRYGLGAKLTNVLSKKFTVTTYDSKSKKKFCMTWTDNMRSKSDPQITDADEGDFHGFTEISFIPDFKFLKMEKGLQQDHIQLMKRRTMDLAGAIGMGTKIYFNKETLKLKSFEDYALLFPKVKAPCAVYRSPCWEIVAAAVSGQRVSVSFVNALFTIRGGTHVEFVADRLIHHIQKTYEKQTGHSVKRGLIASHVSIFVNCRIKNPIFDSQTKKFLKSDPRDYGSLPELGKLFEDFISKTCIFSFLNEYTHRFKEPRISAKPLRDEKSQHIGNIDGFSDAYEAGKTGGSECTLMLTEGLSAKAFAEVGRGILGRDHYGVYALKGKLMNIRGQTPQAILMNRICQNLILILGLRVSVRESASGKYLGLSPNFDLSKTRYGKILIIADPDDDGSHVTGLICNFFHSLSPGLLAKPKFISILQTPLIRASVGGIKRCFFSEQEFHNFLQRTTDKLENLRFYKGLGTNTEDETKECFENIQNHLIPLCYDEKGDGKSLVGFFSRSGHFAAFRRNIIRTKIPEFRPYDAVPVSFSYYNSTRLAAFAHSTCMRTLPNSWDGLVPTQRKVLWTLIQGNFKGYLKVSQLAGYVMERMNYNHGNVPLVEAIRRMAQNYIGSNNIPLLNADGQFGTRYDNGKDAAASRYIFTSLRDIARLIYLPEDDLYLNFRKVEYAEYEPENFFPIVPMSLINGSSGIGVGFRCDIPNHSPHQIIKVLLMRLQCDEYMEKLVPHWNGYRGNITFHKNGGYIAEGCWKLVDRHTIHITEIPPKMSIRTYAKYLEDLVQQEIIKSFKENHLNGYINFFVKVHPQIIAIAGRCQFTSSLFGLTEYSSPLYTHMINNKVVQYADANHLLEEFYKRRLVFLEKKKLQMLSEIDKKIFLLDEQIRFIKLVQKENGDLTSPNSLLKLIESNGFNFQKARSGYSYLLRMPITSFTRDGLQERISMRNDLSNHRACIVDISEKESWINSLKKLQVALPNIQNCPDVEYSPETSSEWKLSAKAMDSLRERLRKFTRTRNDREIRSQHVL